MKRSEKKPLGCGICPYKTNSACHLERHLRIHTGQKPYACDKCSYRATDGGLLKRHMRIHSGEKPFICQICGHKTAQSCSLKDHMAVHTGKKRYSCDLCPFQCSRIGRLRDHQLVHEFAQEDLPEGSNTVSHEVKCEDGKSPKKCSQCDSEFSEQQNLNIHVASVHSASSANSVLLRSDSLGSVDQDSSHFCSLCADSHESSEALENHIATHILYKCLKCNSVFETPDELTTHGFVHSNDLMFDCNFCDFKCRTRNELRGHGRLHSTQKFKCSTCDFQSKSAVEFSQHLMTHTLKEIVVCNICLQKFQKTEDLRDHMVSHYTRVKAKNTRKINESNLDSSKLRGDFYSCFYCSFKCTEESKVEKHIIDMHVSPSTSKSTCESTNETAVEHENFTRKVESHEMSPVPKGILRQLAESPDLGRMQYHRCVIERLSSTEGPHLKMPAWNHHGFTGHFMESTDVNSMSAGSSMSILQSDETCDWPIGGMMSVNHNLYMQTVRSEFTGSATGMKSGIRRSSQYKITVRGRSNASAVKIAEDRRFKDERDTIENFETPPRASREGDLKQKSVKESQSEELASKQRDTPPPLIETDQNASISKNSSELQGSSSSKGVKRKIAVTNDSEAPPKKETPQDVLLAKLRQFFNESFQKLASKHSFRPKPTVRTIELSSDDSN